MSKTDMPVSSPPTALPSFWRRRRRSIIGLSLLVVCVAAALVYNQVRSRAKLEEAFAETDQLDPGWRIQELEAKRLAVPDKENSALVLLAAKQQLPPRWPVWKDQSFPENKDRTQEQVDALQQAFEAPEPAVQLRQSEQQVLRAELKRAAPALAEARKIVELPHGRYPVEYTKEGIPTVLAHTQDARLFANLFAYDALNRAQEKDIDGALESCRGMVRASDSIGDEPTMVSMLARMDIRYLALRRMERVLAQGQASEASLAAMQHLLEAEEKLPLFWIGMRGQRACTDAVMQALQNGAITLAQVPNLSEGLVGVAALDRARMPVLPGSINYQRASLLSWHNAVVGMVENLKTEALRLGLEFQETKARNLPALAYLLHTDCPSMGNIWLLDQASLRSAITLIAAERYRQANGRWPKLLDELVPAYLAKVPSDVYTLKPLSMQRLSRGIVVYSVGERGAHDMLMMGQVAQGGPGTRGTDSAFRLWDVESRRQEPKPEK
jgi:hypothetical protein